jgi:hypothetical protein
VRRARSRLQAHRSHLNMHESNRMALQVLRTFSGLVAACLVLGGCADMPEATYQPAAAKPAFDPASMQAFRTSDPDEIRRRWGDYELLIGETFISDGKNPVEMVQTRWVVQGALSRTDWLNCYESTRKCDENWFWVRYDAAQRRLDFLNGDGSAWAHGEVQADGSLKVTRPSGAPYEVRFDFDRDEGVFFYPAAKTTNRYIPTEAQQYAEVRKTWKQVDAETRAEERRVAQQRAAEQAELAAAQRRAESEESAERWSRGMAALGQAYSDTMAQHRRQQADIAARNARLASSLQSSRPSTSTSSSTSSSTPRTAIPNTSGFTRPQATTLAPSPLTPLPRGATSRTAPASTSTRTPVPLKTNPLQPPRLSEETLVAPQQPQARAPAPSTATSAPAKVAPPTKMVTVPVPYTPSQPEPRTVKPAPTVVATAPPSLRDPRREWEERRQRDGEGEERRDPGKASTRDDPYRCISDAVDAEPVIGSRSSCKAFRVYNRCSAPVDIRTCVYLTAAKKWSCELKSVAPNAYKQHESCSPHSERFVAVKYSDDHKTRTAMPPSR